MTELETAHARIAELEAQLEAIGAGGVTGPLMGVASLPLPGAQEAVAWCQPDDSNAAEAFSWPGTAKRPHHTTPLFTAPQPALSAGWTVLPDQLPEPGKPVLLDIGKEFPIRAMWAAKFTVPSAEDDTDRGEYDEASDEYYAPEGWYEWNQHEETHWAVSETPRAWCELPAPLPVEPSMDGESNADQA